MLATLISVSVTPGAPGLSLAHCALGTVSALPPAPPPDDAVEPPAPPAEPVEVFPPPAAVDCEPLSPVPIDGFPPDEACPEPLAFFASSALSTFVGRRDPH